MTSVLHTASRIAAATLVFALVSLSPAAAQKPTDSLRRPPRDSFEVRTTLAGWADRRRLFVLDRRHNIGGRLYDRGLFRHITPETPRDYAHEMLTQRFPSEAFIRQRRAENSLLVRTGSVRRDLLAFVSRIQGQALMDTSRTVSFDAVLRQDGRASRAFLEMEYAWSPAAHHTLGVRHTFSEYKRDLDLTALYRYSSRRLGRAEVALTFQNLYSDLIDQQLGIGPDDRTVIRDYARHPYLISFSYASPAHLPLRGEVAGGVQPMSRATYESQRQPAYRYRDHRRIHFLGALLEYRYA